mgnify:CR=1 FL=1
MNRFETAARVVDNELGKPYEYGKADCFMLGCQMIDAIQGTDHVETFGGTYDTMAGAQKAMRKQGCKSLSQFFLKKIGLETVTPSFARIGDLAILELDHNGRKAEHVAVFNGRTFTTKTESGSASYGFDAVKACFKV